MHDPVRLHLLGGLRLEHDGRPAAVQRKRLALLAVVARAGTRGVGRERLLALLWPDQDGDEGRHALDVALSALRRALPEGALRAGASGLALEPSCVAVDVLAFEAALAAGDPAAAVATYGGPFLDGVALAGAPDFERWVEEERAVLTRRHRDALAALTAAARTRGDAEGALRWAQAWAAADPLAARAAVALVDALAAVGDFPGAVRAGQVHDALVRAELGLPADPSVAAAVARARPAPAPRVAPVGAAAAAPPGPLDASSMAAMPAAVVPAAASPPSAPRPDAVAVAVRPWLRRHAAAAASLPVMALGAWAFARRPEPTLVDTRVVVAPLVNHTGDPTLDALGQMAADWTTQGLTAAGLGEVVPPPTARAAARYADSLATRGGGDRVRLLAEEARAGLVVTGAIYRTGDTLRLYATIADARRGRVLHAPEPIAAPAHDPAAAVGPLRAHLLGALGPLLDPRLGAQLEERVARARVMGAPPSYEAYREVVQARFVGPRQQIEHLERAAALDTAWATPRVMLATAHYNLRHYAEADSVVRELSRHPERLTAFDAAAVDLVRGWLAGDAAAAYDAARRAAAVAPGGMMSLQVARQALRLNRPATALGVLRTLDPERGELRGQVGYWMLLADTYHLLDRYDDELATLRRARERVPDRPLPDMEARALAALGRRAEVLALIEARLAQPPERYPAVASMLLNVADELARHGQAGTGRQVAARLLAWMDSDAPGAADVRACAPCRADALTAVGHDSAAVALLAPLARGDGADREVLRALGIAAARAGDRATAARMSARLAAATGRDSALFLHDRAAIAAALGDGDGAVTLLRQAFARGLRFIDLQLHQDPAFAALRGTPAFEALVRPRP